LTRVIFGWYTRFDIFAGLMGGFETVLSREWFSSLPDFFQAQVLKEPSNLRSKVDLAVSTLSLIAMDMSLVFAKFGKGEINYDQFSIDNEAIGRRIEQWKSKMDPALQDKSYLVTDFSNAIDIDPEDIVNPYLPNIIYSGPLFAMNLSINDWYSISLLHKHQTALMTQTLPSADLSTMAYSSCQLWEALEYWPGSPAGIVLALQASLGIACLFLPRDERHAMWARHKFATVESNG
jgi:hypothetical protein